MSNISDYLLGVSLYPFKKNVQILAVNTNNNDVVTAIKDYLEKVEYYTENNYTFFFTENIQDSKIKNIQSLIIDDLGVNFKLHKGLALNKELSGSYVQKYIEFIKLYLSKTNEAYTDFFDPITNQIYVSKYYTQELAKYINTYISKDTFVKDLVISYFKNDLNVLKTSKEVYASRGSIFFRFDSIFKETGIDVRNFKDASCLYYLLNYQVLN